METEVIEELIPEEIVSKLSPWSRFKKGLKKVLLFIVTLKIVLETLKLIFSGIMKGINMTRKAVLLSLRDDTWKTVLWIKVWWVVFGLIGGYLLHYFGVFIQLDDWIQLLIDAMG
jgi:hypothetical protein